MNFRRILLLFLLAAFAIIITACGGGGGGGRSYDPSGPASGDDPSSPQMDYKGRLAEKTFVQTDEVKFTIPLGSDLVNDKFDIIAFMPQSELDKIEEGSIIIGYQDGGFLRKVIQIKSTGGDESNRTVVLETAPAILQEAFEEISIKFIGKVSEAQRISQRLIDEEDPAQKIKGSLLANIVNSTTVRTIAPDTKLETDAEIYGGISFDPVLDFSYDYSWLRGLKEFRMIFNGTLKGEFGLKASFEGSAEFEREAVLLSVISPFIIGPVAGAIKMDMPIKINIEGKAEGKVNIGKEVQYQLEFGAIYADGEWGYIREKNLVFENIFEYELKGEAKATVALGLDCTVLLKGLAGPKAGLDLSLELSSEWENENLWLLEATLSYGLDLNFALVFNLWSWEIKVASPEPVRLGEGTLWKGRVPFYTTLKGEVVDKYIKDPLFYISNVQIKIPDPENKDIFYETTTNEFGQFEVDVPLQVTQINLTEKKYKDEVKLIEDDLLPNRVFKWKFLDDLFFHQGTIEMDPIPEVTIYIASGSQQPMLEPGQTEYTYRFDAVGTPSTLLRFDWDFDDGETFSEVVASQQRSTVFHTYKKLQHNDQYDLRVTIFDAGTNEELASDNLTIDFSAPVTTVQIYDYIPEHTFESGVTTSTQSFKARANPAGEYKFVWATSDGQTWEDTPVSGNTSEASFTFSGLTDDKSCLISVSLYNPSQSEELLDQHSVIIKFKEEVYQPPYTPPYTSGNIRWKRYITPPNVRFK